MSAITNLKHRDFNFMRLTQTKYIDGQPVLQEIKEFAMRKGPLLLKMKRMLVKQSPAFWHDLARKNEATVHGPYGSKIHFKLEAIDGDFATGKTKTWRKKK